MIRPDHHLMLNAYANRMGVPVQQCIDEAIDDWLTIVAPARLDEPISHIEKQDNVVPFIKIAR